MEAVGWGGGGLGAGGGVSGVEACLRMLPVRVRGLEVCRHAVARGHEDPARVEEAPQHSREDSRIRHVHDLP